MYCTKCGATVQEGAAFCRQCGQPVGSAVTTAMEGAGAEGATHAGVPYADQSDVAASPNAPPPFASYPAAASVSMGIAPPLRMRGSGCARWLI